MNISPHPVSSPSRSYATAKRIAKGRPGFDVWGNLPDPNLTKADFMEDPTLYPELSRFDAHEYKAVVDLFQTISHQFGADWPLALKQEFRPSKEILNDLGCFTYKIGRTRSLPAELYLAMFAGASALGCEASCISVASVLFNSDRRLQAVPLYKPIKMRFDRIIRESRNPNAAAVEAERLLQEGKKPGAAARVAQRALELAGHGDFTWRPLCMHTLGRAYEAQGHPGKALECYREATLGGENRSWEGVAKTATDPKEQREAWFRAGQMGSEMGFNRLSEHFRNLSAQIPSSDSKEKKRLDLWAAEWGRLNDPKALH